MADSGILFPLILGVTMQQEVIKLAMCGSHGFSSDVCMRNFVHGD